MAVEHGGCDLVVIAGLVIEQGREILERVVCLQVGRLVGDHGVGGAVGLVEPVAGEKRHQVEDLGRFRLGHAALDRPGDEFGPHLRHLVFLLLAHGGAKHIGFSQGEAGQLGGDLHDLLLVDDDAVGLFENRLELRQRVDDLLLAVLALHVLVEQAAFEWPRAEEGNRRGDVIEGRRAHVLEEAAQPGGLELEDAVRVRRL